MRYKAIIEYDGTNFAGWQKQKNQETVQSVLEAAIFAFCQEEIDVFASGRTDSGVHARGQVVHFDMSDARDCRSVTHGINYHLEGKPIALISTNEMSDDFHARFNATKRYYRYCIVNREAPLVLDINRAWVIYQPLDEIAMAKAAEFLIGKHDFTSFRDSQCQAKSPIKTIDKITITRDGDNIYIDIEALSFLHHMVRNIVGTLSLAGRGKWQPEDLQKALAAKDRCAAGQTAPACGLYFMKVDYKDKDI